MVRSKTYVRFSYVRFSYYDVIVQKVNNEWCCIITHTISIIVILSFFHIPTKTMSTYVTIENKKKWYNFYHKHNFSRSGSAFLSKKVVKYTSMEFYWHIGIVCAIRIIMQHLLQVVLEYGGHLSSSLPQYAATTTAKRVV